MSDVSNRNSWWTVSTSKKRIAIAMVLALIWVIGASTIWEKAHATEDDRQAERGAPILADPKIWGARMAENFRAGKLGTSKGRGIPKKVRQAMEIYKITMELTGNQVDRWWETGGMDKMECAWNGMYWPGPAVTDQLFCMKAASKPTVRKINRQITKMRVICGGAAAIGMVGGTAVAFGSGVGACVYSEYATRAFNWMN